MKCTRENNAHVSIGVELIVRFVVTMQVIILVASCNNQTVNEQFFQLNPVIDSPYHYRVHFSENISVAKTPSEKRTEFTIAFRPVSDSIYSFTFQFTRVDTSLLLYFDQMDSLRKRKSGAEALQRRATYSAAFREAQNDVFQGRVNKNGELISVKGFDAMKERITEKLNMDRRDVHSMLHEQTGDAAVEKLVNLVFIGIPGKNVKVEDNWVRNIMDNTRSPVKLSHLITFTEMRDDTAVLRIQTAVSAKTGAEGTLFESGKGTGEWKIQRQTGLPIEWNSRQETEYRTMYDTTNRTILAKGQLIQRS